MVRNFITRRAGGSETTKWSQPGSRFAALRGLRGVPKESAVPPSLKHNMLSAIKYCVIHKLCKHT